MGRNQLGAIAVLGVLVVALTTAAVPVGASGTAAANRRPRLSTRARPPQPPTLSWRRETSAGNAMSATANAVVLSGAGSSLLVINAATDARTTVTPPPDCRFGVSGGPWLVFNCETFSLADGHHVASLLYSTAAGRWDVPDPAAVGQVCDLGPGSCQPVAVGSDWVEWDLQECPGGTHCSDDFFYQSIASGGLERPVAPGGHLWDDMDTVGLAHALCAPLIAPVDFSMYDGDIPGAISFYGRYAVVTPAPADSGPAIYLEECGTHLHQLLESDDTIENTDAGGPTGNRRTLAWLTSAETITALALPSLVRSSWTLPARLGSASAITIVSHRIFANTSAGVFSAALGSGH